MKLERPSRAWTLALACVLGCCQIGTVWADGHPRGRIGEVERRRTENERTPYEATSASGEPNRKANNQSATQRAESPNAARREAMRRDGIPTSQQPVSQSRNEAGREYRYEVPKSGGGIEQRSVQQQTKDRSHAESPHWEAGRPKIDPVTGEVRNNRYGRPALEGGKSKVEY